MRKTSRYLCSCSAFPGFLGEPLKNEHKPLQAPVPTVTRRQAGTCVCQGLVFLGEPRALGCRAEASEPLPRERSCCPGEKGRVTNPHRPLSLLQPAGTPKRTGDPVARGAAAAVTIPAPLLYPKGSSARVLLHPPAHRSHTAGNTQSRGPVNRLRSWVTRARALSRPIPPHSPHPALAQVTDPPQRLLEEEKALDSHFKQKTFHVS